MVVVITGLCCQLQSSCRSWLLLLLLLLLLEVCDPSWHKTSSPLPCYKLPRLLLLLQARPCARSLC
jgi:hypothetical protein